jgi:hypothetical protein
MSIPTVEELKTETATLPAGWVAGWSKTYQARFYYHAATQTSQYVRPTADGEPPRKKAHSASAAGAALAKPMAVSSRNPAAASRFDVYGAPERVRTAVSAPLHEWVRAKAVRGLRHTFDLICQRWLDRSPPKEAFNRWIYLQLATPLAVYPSAAATGPTATAGSGLLDVFGRLLPLDTLPAGIQDPLLPCPRAAALSAVLRHEIRGNFLFLFHLISPFFLRLNNPRFLPGIVQRRFPVDAIARIFPTLRVSSCARCLATTLLVYATFWPPG